MSKRYAEQAVAELRSAIAAGYANLDALKKDPDFKILQHQEGFRQMLEREDAGRAPGP
jgi:hypothetical protein